MRFKIHSSLCLENLANFSLYLLAGSHERIGDLPKSHVIVLPHFLHLSNMLPLWQDIF